MEILLLHPGALGDIILSLPAIALLRNRFPSAGITVAGNVDYLAPVASGYAERIVSLSTLPLHHLHAPRALPKEEQFFWRSFDRIVSWTGEENPEFITKIKEIHPNACVAGWRPQPGETRHVSQLFAGSLGFAPSPHKGLEPAPIRLDAAWRNEGLQYLVRHGWNEKETLAALHPGAGGIEKRWMLSRFVRLARNLALQEKHRLLIIEGPAETGLAGEMQRHLPEGHSILAESVPLNLLAALIEPCRIFVGNDSGISHLAAALNVPCVVLFGPSLPQHWAPLGEKVAVLRDPRGCEGCARGSSHHTCLDNLSVEEVMQNLIAQAWRNKYSVYL